MMGRIYSTAEQTVAWLGLEPEHSLHKLLTMRWHPTDFDTLLTNLESICTNGYWQRLWIVQGFVLSKSVDIWSGASTLSSFGFDILFVTATSRRRDHILKRIKYPWKVGTEELRAEKINIRRRDHHPQDKSLVLRTFDSESAQIFVKFGQARCSDVRDRVYGLLGLINPQELEEFPITPEYSKSTSALFVELVARDVAQVDEVRSPEDTIARETNADSCLSTFAGTLGGVETSWIRRVSASATGTQRRRRGSAAHSSKEVETNVNCDMESMFSIASSNDPIDTFYTKSNTSPLSLHILPTLFPPTILSSSILSHLLKHTLTLASAVLISALSILLPIKASASS
jgi:hypothetical protein